MILCMQAEHVDQVSLLKDKGRGGVGEKRGYIGTTLDKLDIYNVMPLGLDSLASSFNFPASASLITRSLAFCLL